MKPSKLGNVNAVTVGRIILPKQFAGIPVCTLPKELGKWMTANKVDNVTVNEYGFKSNYRLIDGWAELGK